MEDGYIRLLRRISHTINLRPASLFGFEHSWRKLPWHRLDLCGHAIHIRHRPSNLGKTKTRLIFCIYIYRYDLLRCYSFHGNPRFGERWRRCSIARMWRRRYSLTLVILVSSTYCTASAKSAERIANACFWRRLDKSGSTNMCRRYDVFLQRQSNRHADRTVTWSVLLVGGRRDVWTDGRILVLYWGHHLQRRRYAGNVGAGRPP